MIPGPPDHLAITLPPILLSLRTKSPLSTHQTNPQLDPAPTGQPHRARPTTTYKRRRTSRPRVSRAQGGQSDASGSTRVRRAVGRLGAQPGECEPGVEVAVRASGCTPAWPCRKGPATTPETEEKKLNQTEILSHPDLPKTESVPLRDTIRTLVSNQTSQRRGTSKGNVPPPASSR